MIDARSRRNSRGERRESTFDNHPSGDHASGDDESRMAASLRAADDPDEGPPSIRTSRGARLRVASPAVTPESRAAESIAGAVEARLPGRICDLEVRAESDHFVIAGVASSYYVKQVAQHVAMNALNEVMLARLVNEITVRSMR